MAKKNYRFNYQFRLRNSFKWKIVQLFKDMTEEKWDHNKFLEIRGHKIFNNDWKLLAGYNQSYLIAYMDALYEQMWSNEIEWKVYHPEKGLIKSNLVKEGKYSEPIPRGGAFVWKNTNFIFYRTIELSWNDVNTGDIIYEYGFDKLYGPFVIMDIDQQCITNPKNNTWFRTISLKYFFKKEIPEYISYKEEY